MMATLAAGFGAADWAVLGAYMCLIVVTAWWFSRRESKTTNEYFLAERRMPMWAVSVSIIATSLSAATFIGAPEISYKGDLTYLSTNIGTIIAVVIVAYVFIPAFYRNNVTTVYELLERRFGTGSKAATSAAFMVGRLFASGARIYIAAIPLSMILFGADVDRQPGYIGYMTAAIAALALVGTIYTLFGGISSVIWTDVIQTIVLVVAVIAAIVVLYLKIDQPVGEIIRSLRATVPDGAVTAGSFGKLTVLDPGVSASNGSLGINFGDDFTLITAVTGFALLGIAAYGTDHDLVQRMLTCKNAIQGSRSVLWSMALGLPLVTAFLVVGLLLAVYQPLFDSAAFNAMLQVSGTGGSGSSPTPAFIRDSKYVFVRFIINDMPAGLAGLMLAGLFAAGVGSLTSAINAMAATLVKDFYTRWNPGRTDKHYLSAGRWAVVGWGIALAAVAVLCLIWQRASPGTTLIGLALGVMTFAYAGLLAVFCTALFTKRGNSTSVIASLITGFIVIALLQDWSWPYWTKLISPQLATVKIAFPWHMVIGTAAAFIVCCLGRPRVEPGSLGTHACPHCGYNRSDASTTARCPECGTDTPAATTLSA